MDLAKLQEKLLKQRDEVLRSLGLDEINERYEATLSKAEEARRRKPVARAVEEDDDGAAGAAAAAEHGMRRRSMRVRGIGPDGAPLEMSAKAEKPEGAQRARPEGHVSWEETLRYKHAGRIMGAAVLNDWREATARLLSLPVPAPVDPNPAPPAAAPAADAGAAASAEAAAAAAPKEAEKPGTKGKAAGKGKGKAAPAKGKGKGKGKAAADADDESDSDSDSDIEVVEPAAPALSLGTGVPEGGLTAAFDADAGYALPLPNPGSSSSSSSSSASAASPGKGKKPAARAGAGVVGGAGASSSGGGGGTASALTGLGLRDVSAVLKVVDDRIYSVAFHPSPHKIIALCGSKSGLVGVWEPDMARLLPASASSAASAGSTSSAGTAGATSPPSTKRARKGDDDGEAGAASAADTGAAADADAGDDAPDGITASGGRKGANSSGSPGASVGSKRRGPVAASGAGAAAAADADDEDGGDAPRDVLTVFSPHDSPVNYMQVPRGAPHLLLTCAYDGSIRALDFNRGISWELSHEDGGRDSGVSAMDICDVAPAIGASSSSAGAGGAGAAAAAAGSVGVGISGTVIVGMYDGRVGLLDVRTPTLKRSMANAFTAHNRKVTAASACGSTYFLTSSSDSTVKLWDARKIAEGSSGRKSGSGTRAPVAETGSSQAVTSAFFSPMGTRVIATCNDNKLRLWDVDWATTSFKATHAIYHNNHTGRWLSAIRAVFDPSDEDIFISGNMDRSLEVFSAVSGERLAALSSDYLTAVPTLNCAHPTLAPARFMLSGTASGRLHLWS